jgi:diguanylate cyclase (GGDEF)-like protein
METIAPLFISTGLTQALYAMGWMMVAALIREHRHTAWHFVGFCGFHAAALLLMAGRGGPLSPWWSVTASNLCVIASYLMVWRGVTAFFRLEEQTRERRWVGALAMLASLAVGPAPDQASARVVVVACVIVWVIVRAVMAVHRPMAREFGTRLSWLINGTALLMALLLSLRIAEVLLQPRLPSDIVSTTAANPGFAYAAQIISAFINFAYGGMLMARVMRRLDALSRTDVLTGLLNRRAMGEVLHDEWLRFTRHRTPLSVGLLDIDHFKAVNDTHGHDVGDQVLRHVATTLQAQIRPIDRLSRHGGEEFLLLMPSTDAAGARQACERLCRVIATTPAPTTAGPLPVTASIGVASAAPSDGRIDDVLVRADQALYDSKRNGRNRVTLV